MLLPNKGGNLDRKSVHDYGDAIRERYRAASRGQKGVILKEFCATTGYHSKAAIRLLRNPLGSSTIRRGQPPKYGLAEKEVLKTCWEAADRICSKRLAPFMPSLLDSLERHEEIVLAEELHCKLAKISPATIDRLLKATRNGATRRPYRQSKSTSVLRAQIPIRTFGEWTNVAPGSLQVDLVLHCGDSTEGFYLTTLVGTDVAIGWTELEAVWGKGQQRVGSGVHRIRQGLPFILRELHSDNGGEFINEIVYAWCQREGIKFTRGRPYKKNDQAYVEQKNWSTVRRLVGYDRYATKAAFEQLREVYIPLGLYVNFFQPIRKLIGKKREGAKVRKTYDVAQTPYERLLAAGVLNECEQKSLEELFRSLNPVKLRQEIDEALELLWKLAERPGTAAKATVPGTAPKASVRAN